MSDENTVEVAEPTAAPEVIPPTRDELKQKGWSAKEMDAAEKRGMIQKPETAEEKAKKEADAKAKAESEAKAKTGASGADKGEEGKSKEEIPKTPYKGTPLDEVVLTPEQEKVFTDTFGTGSPVRAMYFRQKNERKARQTAEAQLREERTARLAAEERAKSLEVKKTDQMMDEDGNLIDPEDKPLTMKALKELKQQEKDEEDKQKKELNDHARQVVQAQTDQEEYARSVYPDFDETVGRVGDLLKNLEAYVPEPWKQAKIRRLAAELGVAAAHADKIDPEEYHAAMIAYELGQFHPKYGQKADPTKNGDASDKDGNPKDPKKGNGALTPEQMKRIEDNNQRRASSASISGSGGTRTISVDDVDAGVLAKMSYSERQRFKEKHPDRYKKLLRG